MIHGACHCGGVRWQYDATPESATACNCTVCRRYGALWAYHFEGTGIQVTGTTQAYERGRHVSFHFCPTCGCLTHWRGQQLLPDGQRRAAVNLRMAEPEAVAGIPVDHFDGLDTFDDLPSRGRRVADHWF
jgi:hypothetical protein